MNRFFRATLAILVIAISLSSCFNQFGAVGPTIGGKKRKKTAAPPYDFSKSMFDYRKERGYWPKSEMDFGAYNSQVIRNLYLSDFSEWYLGENTDDSLYVYFTHDPVTSNGRVGVVPIPVKDIKIKTLYIFSKGLIKSKLEKDED